jgi:hypothetical protein
MNQTHLLSLAASLFPSPFLDLTVCLDLVILVVAVETSQQSRDLLVKQASPIDRRLVEDLEEFVGLLDFVHVFPSPSGSGKEVK